MADSTSFRMKDAQLNWGEKPIEDNFDLHFSPATNLPQ